MCCKDVRVCTGEQHYIKTYLTYAVALDSAREDALHKALCSVTECSPASLSSIKICLTRFTSSRQRAPCCALPAAFQARLAEARIDITAASTQRLSQPEKIRRVGSSG